MHAAYTINTMAMCLQAVHSQRVQTTLGESSGEETHLNSVVELMLDITESSVAFCWELGAGRACTHHLNRPVLSLHVTLPAWLSHATSPSAAIARCLLQ